MRESTRVVLRLAVTAAAAFALLLASAAAVRAAAPSPKQLLQALLQTPPAGSLPPALGGSAAKGAKLSRGARAHHAVGAAEIGNSAALVGFLVFPTHALAVADLKAYPPDRGPNTIVSRTPAGLPRPAYILRAAGNGFEAAYAVFVVDNVLVDAWTYGQKGTSGQLRAIVERDARWANAYVSSLNRGSK